jgi:hypothetical protein
MSLFLGWGGWELCDFGLKGKGRWMFEQVAFGDMVLIVCVAPWGNVSDLHNLLRKLNPRREKNYISQI